MIKSVWAKVAAVAGTTALIVGGSTIAAQASTTLPASDALYGLNCDNALPYSVAGIDTSDGSMTGVGQETDIQSDCFGSGAYDAVTGYSYALDWDYGGNNESLVQINLADGTRTIIGQFYDPTNDYEVSVGGIAIDSQGNAYLSDYNNGYLYSLDLTNAYATQIGDMGSSDIYALAFDNNDTLYGIIWDYGSSSDILSINTSTGSSSVVGNWWDASGGYSTGTSLQFDSNNVAWILDNQCCQAATLWTISDMSNINATTSQENTPNYSGSDTYIQALLLTTGTQTNPGVGAEATAGTLYSLNCDSGDPYTLSTLNTTDATLTGIGVETLQDSTCFGQAAWDATTKTGYVVDWNYSNAALSRINFETGHVTLINEFQGSPGSNYDMDSIAINTKGEAFATYNGYLYSLDLATGRVTDIGQVVDARIYALAFDPKTDKLYGTDWSNNDVLEINTTDASSTVVGSTSALTDPYIPGMQFTETGAVYFVDNSDRFYKATSAATMGDATLVGTMSQNSTDTYTESLLYPPATPSLPDTGLNGVSATVGGLSVVFLIAAGAVLLVVRRRMAQQ